MSSMKELWIEEYDRLAEEFPEKSFDELAEMVDDAVADRLGAWADEVYERLRDREPPHDH